MQSLLFVLSRVTLSRTYSGVRGWKANVMDDVKDSLYGNSTKKLFSFLIRTEDITDEELLEIMQMVRKSPIKSIDTKSSAPANGIRSDEP